MESYNKISLFFFFVTHLVNPPGGHDADKDDDEHSSAHHSPPPELPEMKVIKSFRSGTFEDFHLRSHVNWSAKVGNLLLPEEGTPEDWLPDELNEEVILPVP